MLSLTNNNTACNRSVASLSNNKPECMAATIIDAAQFFLISDTGFTIILCHLPLAHDSPLVPGMCCLLLQLLNVGESPGDFWGRVLQINFSEFWVSTEKINGLRQCQCDTAVLYLSLQTSHTVFKLTKILSN